MVMANRIVWAVVLLVHVGLAGVLAALGIQL